MRMGPLRLALVLLAILWTPAYGQLSENALSGVGIQLAQGARIPASLHFHDVAERSLSFGDALGGKPALLIPVDYTCKSICGTALTLAADALSETKLVPGRDYRLIAVGIDAKDGPDQARKMAEANIHAPGILAASSVLLGDAPTTKTFLAAIGYRDSYDAGHDQFAHPAVALAIASDGRIVRAFSSLALNPTDLRLGLIEAGEGRIGTLGDRLTLICYGFDPARGIYTPLIQRLLWAMAVATIAIMGALLLLLFRPRRI